MASPSQAVQDLLAKNSNFVKTFEPPFSIAEFAKLLATTPGTPRVCIITCCDPRVVPEFIFNLKIGEAIVIRNVGGSVDLALSSVLSIDTVGPITDLIVMRHTDCGTAYWTDEGVRTKLKERTGGHDPVGRRGEKLEDMAFGESEGHTGDEKRLKEDVEWLKASPLIREKMKEHIIGMVYITETGQVKVVC